MKRLLTLVLVSVLVGACADKGSTDAADRADNAAHKATSSPSADVKRVLIESLDKDLAPAAGDPDPVTPAPGTDEPTADRSSPATSDDASLDEAEAADRKFLSIFGGPPRRSATTRRRAPRRVATVRPRPRSTGPAATRKRSETPQRKKAAAPASPGTVSKLRDYELNAIAPGSGPGPDRKGTEKPNAKPTDKRVDDAYSGDRGFIDSLGAAKRAALKSRPSARRAVKRSQKPRDTAGRQPRGTLDEGDTADDEVLKVLGGD